jgi:hypothetical protein
MYKRTQAWTGAEPLVLEDCSVNEALLASREDVTTKPFGFFVEGFKDECWRIRVTDEDGVDDPASLGVAAALAKEKKSSKRRGKVVMTELRAAGMAKPVRGVKKQRRGGAAPVAQRSVINSDTGSDDEFTGC